MAGFIPIKRALISVSDKSYLEDLARLLAQHNIEILSTGGSAQAIRDMGLPVTDVSDVTGFPEIMDGRVKTLHPKIHGGILGDREKHSQAFLEHGIDPIDLVVINLYPFEENPSIETIDIGGPAMLRASAKNHKYVCVVPDTEYYDLLFSELETNNGATTEGFREYMAFKTFQRTAAYDAAIQNWLAPAQGSIIPSKFIASGSKLMDLRYGENPHQQAAVYYSNPEQIGVLTAKQLQGKELSYNNINDTDAAFELVSEFDMPAVAIIKHANPCGAAMAADIFSAWEKALASDPISAFGGIVAVNKPITKALAEAMSEIFLEVIIAPKIDPAAVEILATKKNLRVLITGQMPDPTLNRYIVKSVAGGYLLQERDSKNIPMEEFKNVTTDIATEDQLLDLHFANLVCKHVKSNAIVIVKDGATVGIGEGQTSRVDAAVIAAAQAGEKGQGAVAASDAFFPFPDGLEVLLANGVKAVVQPGGSKNDQMVIEAANNNGMAMVFSNTRHFKH